MKFLYNDGTDVWFMDNETFDQISIPAERLTWELNFIKEDSDVTITYYENEIIGIDLPVKVALKIVETDDATRGDTINNPQKEATLDLKLKSQCLSKMEKLLLFVPILVLTTVVLKFC